MFSFSFNEELIKLRLLSVGSALLTFTQNQIQRNVCNRINVSIKKSKITFTNHSTSVQGNGSVYLHTNQTNAK
jgi:phosphoribosylformylglycinamidine (FGAM) synthase-like amidotransferase family enzyme